MCPIKLFTTESAASTAKGVPTAMAETTFHGRGIPSATEPVRVGTAIDLHLRAGANVNDPRLRASSYFDVNGHTTRRTEHAVGKQWSRQVRRSDAQKWPHNSFVATDKSR